MADKRSKPFLTWHDRDELELGAVYVTDEADATLEFVGIVSAKTARRLVALPETVQADDDNEPVLLFVEPEHDAPGDAPSFWTHTRHDTEQGFIFQSLADRVLDEGTVDGGAAQ